VPNDRTIFKNWSDDGGIPYSNSVSRKTSALKPFKIVQTSIGSGANGANIVNMQIPRQVITYENSRSLNLQRRSIELWSIIKLGTVDFESGPRSISFYDHVPPDLPQTFKVNGSKVKVIA